MKGYSEFKGYRTQMAFDGETRSFVSVKDAFPGHFEWAAAGQREQAACAPHPPCGTAMNNKARPIDVP